MGAGQDSNVSACQHQNATMLTSATQLMVHRHGNCRSHATQLAKTAGIWRAVMNRHMFQGNFA
jgi:hypothetical protein